MAVIKHTKWFLFISLLTGFFLFTVQANAITRAKIIQNAEKFVQVQWTCSAANVNHPYTAGGCPPSDFVAGQTYRGEAYSYGGNDSVEKFLQRIANGDGAGSHLSHYRYYGGVPSWATGIDCSAYVSQVWEIPRQSTATLPNYSTEISRGELKAGDILNKPHSHVRLFEKRAIDGRPIVYEASGSATKVVHRAVSWGDYTPRRFNQLLVPVPAFLVKRIGPRTARIVWEKLPKISKIKVYTSLDGQKFNFFKESFDSTLTLENLSETQPTYVRLISGEPSGEESLPGEVLAVQPGETRPGILIVYGYDRPKSTNTKDFIRSHASAISENGQSFESCSNEMVANGTVDLNDYIFVDWILGEESTANHTFDDQEQAKVKAYLENGGGLFVSGAEIAWDLDHKNYGRSFFRNYLKARYVRDDSKVFAVIGTPEGRFDSLGSIAFGDGRHGTYTVKWADCISPVNGSEADLLYAGTSYTAGIEYSGTFGNSSKIGKLTYWGFPFETVTYDSLRKELMGKILGFMGYTVANVPFVQSGGISPENFLLSQLFPNPIQKDYLQTKGATIRFRFSDARHPVNIRIYNILGQLIYEKNIQNPQIKRFTWRGNNSMGHPVSAGTYFYQIVVAGRRYSRKILVLK